MKKEVKPRRPRVSMPKTFEEILKINRYFFQNADSEEASKYADVISALRGPDSNKYQLKSATTCLIRRTFLGPEYNRPSPNGWLLGDKDTEIDVMRRHAMEDGHFKSHVWWAFHTLGLAWDKVNYPETKESSK